MPRTKGSKNRPKTNITKDYAAQIAEKQETIASLNTEIASIQKAIEEQKNTLKEKKNEAEAGSEESKGRCQGCRRSKEGRSRSRAEEVAGQRDECGRDSGKAEITQEKINAVWTN